MGDMRMAECHTCEDQIRLHPKPFLHHPVRSRSVDKHRGPIADWTDNLYSRNRECSEFDGLGLESQGSRAGLLTMVMIPSFEELLKLTRTAGLQCSGRP